MAIAIRVVVDRISYPHRVPRRARAFGNRFRFVRLQIEDVESVCFTSAVTLFRTEVARLWRVNHACSVGRVITRACFRHRQSLGWSTIDRHRVKPRDWQRPGISLRFENDALAVLRPAINLIVPTPPWSERPLCRIKSKLPRHPARRRNDVDLLVAIVLTGERDPFPVWRKLRENFHTGMGSQTNCRAAVRRRRPNVAAVSKGYAVAVDVGETEQFCLRGRDDCEQRNQRAGDD